MICVDRIWIDHCGHAISEAVQILLLVVDAGGIVTWHWTIMRMPIDQAWHGDLPRHVDSLDTLCVSNCQQR